MLHKQDILNTKLRLPTHKVIFNYCSNDEILQKAKILQINRFEAKELRTTTLTFHIEYLSQKARTKSTFAF